MFIIAPIVTLPKSTLAMVANVHGIPWIYRTDAGVDGYHDAAPVKDLPCEFTSRDNKAMHANPDLRVVLK